MSHVSLKFINRQIPSRSWKMSSDVNKNILQVDYKDKVALLNYWYRKKLNQKFSIFLCSKFLPYMGPTQLTKMI